MITLDHAGIVAPDLAALHAAYRALGFTLTPLSRQSGRLTADGPVVPFGTANRCAMLRHGYIELLGIVDPEAPANGIDTFLARYPGLHILAFGIQDEDAALARLRRAGLDIPGILHLQRPVDETDPAGPTARFARIPLPDAPEGRIQLIRHLTPEVLWQDRYLHHSNRAVALDSVLLATQHPADTAARLGRLSGRPVVPDPAGGFALPLHHGRVRVLHPSALAALLPGLPIPCLPFMAAITVRTDDAAAAARTIAPLQPVPGGWMAQSGGTAIVFT